MSVQPISTIRSTGQKRKCARFGYVCLVFLPVLLVFSCTPVAMLIYGVHQPKYRSDEAVVKLYNRLGLEGEVHRLKGYTAESLSRFRYTSNGMPGMLLFNSKGQLTIFELDCSGGLDSIASLATLDIDKMKLAEKSLDDFLNDTYVINSTATENLLDFDKPLYVIKFAEYAGRLNKDNVPALVSRLESRNDVDYILLNVDYAAKK